MRKKKDPLAETVTLLGRVVTIEQLTQFQIKTINRRLDALEKTAAPPRPRRKARR
jgi:hypothetical protein